MSMIDGQTHVQYYENEDTVAYIVLYKMHVYISDD